jgi:hypothetical protein
MWSFILTSYFHLNLCFPNSTFPIRFSDSESAFISTYSFPYIFLRRLPMIPVTVRSEAWFCVCSLAGISGSNPDGGTDVCLLRFVFLVQVQASATGRSLVQGIPTACYVSLIVIRRHNNPLHLQLVGRRGRTKELPSEPLQHTA